MRKFATRVRGIGLWAWLSLALLPISSYAQARYEFNLPAQQLTHSLRFVARKAQVTVAFDPVLVSSVQAPALKGRFTAREALDRLLKGSNLRAGLTEGGSFWLEVLGPVAPDPN